MLLLLAGSLASWSLGDGGPPTNQSASPVAGSAMPAPVKPVPSADVSERPTLSTAASEEDALRRALAALASVPPAFPSNASAAAPLPSLASLSTESSSGATTPVTVPLAPSPSAPSMSKIISHHTTKPPKDAEGVDTSTEDLNQQSLNAVRKSSPDATTPVTVPLTPFPPAPGTSTAAISRPAKKLLNEVEDAGTSTEDLNKQSLDAAQVGRVFISRTVPHKSESQAQQP